MKIDSPTFLTETTFISASVQFSSGSQKFGNTSDDIHQFTGSLAISGDMGKNISGSSTSTGSFGAGFIDNKLGIGTTSPVEALHVAGKAYVRRTGTATAHGDTDLFVADSTAGGSTAQLQILGGASGASLLYFSDTDSYSVGGIRYYHSDNRMNFRVNDTDILDITSTKISGSATSTGSFGKLYINGTPNQAAAILNVEGHAEFADGIMAMLGSKQIKNYNHAGTNISFASALDLSSEAVLSLKSNNSNNNKWYIGLDGSITGSAGNHISASSTSTGSFGKVSISDRLHIGVPASPNNGLRYIDGSGFRIISDDDIHLEMSDVFKFVGGPLQIGSSTFLDTSNNATFASLKTTGNISGSSTSTGSFGDGRFASRLSVGTQESPSAYNSGADTLLVSEPSSHAGITIRSSTSDTGNIHFADGTSGTAAYRGVLQYAHSDDRMRFFTAGSSRMTLDSSGILKDMAGVSGSSTSTGSFGSTQFGGRFELAEKNYTFTLKDIANSRTYFSATTGAAITIGFGNNADITLDTGAKVVIPRGTGVSGSLSSTGSFGRLELAGFTISKAGASDKQLVFGNTSEGADIFHDTSEHELRLTSYSSAVKSSEIHLQGRAAGDGASRGGILFRTATHQHTINGPQDAVYINLSGSVELMRDGANLSGSATSTGSFGKIDTANITENSSGVQIGTAGNHTTETLRVNNKIIIHQDSSGAGDSELTFDRRHDGAYARIQAKAGASGAMGTELHFVTKLAGASEQTVLQLDDNGHIYSDLANAKISGSATSTGSFGKLAVGHGSMMNHSTIKTDLAGDLNIRGGLFANYSDGSTNRGYVAIGLTASSFGQIAQNEGGMWNVQNGALRFATNNTQALVIDTSQNLLASGNVSGSATSTGSFGRVKASLGESSLAHPAYSFVEDDDTGIGSDEVGTIQITTAGTQALGFNSSQTATFAGDLQIPAEITHVGDSNTLIRFDTDQIKLQAGGNPVILNTTHLSGSATSTGSFGQLVIDGTGTAGNFIKGNTTIGTSTTYNGFPLNVGGNIYAISGDVYVNDNFGIRNASDSDVRIRFNSTNGITMGNAAGNTILHAVDTTIDFTSATTISGSASSTGSFGRLNVGNGGSTVQPRFRVTDGVGSLPTMHPEQGDLAIFQNNASTSDISAIYAIAGTAGSSHYVFGDADGKNVGRVSYDHSSNAMTLHTNTTEQVRIDSSGKVGIGTTSPTKELQVTGEISSSGTGYFSNIILGGTEQIAVNNGNLYYTGGNLGIGTSSPGKLLTLSADVSGETQQLLIVNKNDSDGDTSGILFGVLDDATYAKAGIFFERTHAQARGSLHFATDSASDSGHAVKANARMTITQGGLVGIGTTSPDSLLHLFSTSATPKLTFESQHAGTQGPQIDLFVSSSSPAVADELGDINFVGMDSTGVKTFYSMIRGLINNPTNGSETGGIQFNTRVNGSSAARMIISGSAVGIGTTSPGRTLDVVGEGRFSSDVTIGSGGSTPDLIFDQGDSQITGPLNANFLIKSRGNSADEGVSIQGADGAGLKINKAGDAIFDGDVSGSATSTGSFGKIFALAPEGENRIGGGGTAIGSNFTLSLNMFNGRDVTFRGTGTDRELGITTSTVGAWKFFFKNNSGGSDGSTGVGIGQVPADNVELDVYGDIEYTGTITDVSLRSIKENIVQITGSEAGMIDKFKQVPLYKYNLKPDAMNVNPTPMNNFTTSSIRQHPKYVKNSPKYGLIADDADLENAFPELVQWRMEGEASGSINTSKIGIDTTSYIGMLHGVIKELVTKVETLETQMAQVSGSS